MLFDDTPSTSATSANSHPWSINCRACCFMSGLIFRFAMVSRRRLKRKFSQNTFLHLQTRVQCCNFHKETSCLPGPATATSFPQGRWLPASNIKHLQRYHWQDSTVAELNAANSEHGHWQPKSFCHWYHRCWRCRPHQCPCTTSRWILRRYTCLEG
jgi:hypothetical protein